MPERPAPGAVEQRALAPDAEPVAVDGRKLRGVIPYGVPSLDLGGFTERMEPGCLRDAALSNLVATVHHDPSRVLGRFPTTLTVEDRADGLHWSCELPSGPTGEDVRVAVERGDIRASSWRMIVAPGGDEWRGDVRHIRRVAELRDVAVTAIPAYGDEARAEFRAAPFAGATPVPDPAPPREETPPMDTETTDPRAETTDAPPPTSGLRVENRTAAPPSVEARVIDALRGVPKGEARALTTTVSVSPGEVSTVLFDKLRASSVGLRSGFRVVATDKDSIVWPSLTADVAPDWYAEAAPITPGDPTFGTVPATPRKLAHLVQLSNEVIEDSDPSIVEVLNDHLLKVLALKLDAGLFAGTGTPPQIRGLRNVAGIQTVPMGTDGASLTNLDPIADALGLLEAANTTGTAIVMAPRTFTALRKLKTAPTGSNEPLLTEAASASSDIAPRVYGVPVYVSGQLAINETQGTSTDATSIYVYNASEIVFVRRTEIELELDRSRLFNSDQSELRARMRGDLIVPNPAAVVRVAGIRP